MLVDHADTVCVPINLHHDLSFYAHCRVIIQKVTAHMNVEEKGKEAFEAD